MLELQEVMQQDTAHLVLDVVVVVDAVEDVVELVDMVVSVVELSDLESDAEL